MGAKYNKWYEFPLMVKYGESGMIMHLNKKNMLYHYEVNGSLSTAVHCKKYINNPELFEQINSEMYRHRVLIEQQPVIIDWCIGKQPEPKKK